MKIQIVLVSAMLLMSCTSQQGLLATNNRTLTSEEAIRLATKEIRTRRLPLPDEYLTTVKKSEAFHATRLIYVVTFRTSRKDRATRLYYVHIDRLSGKSVDVIDLRGAIPAGRH